MAGLSSLPVSALTSGLRIAGTLGATIVAVYAALGAVQGTVSENGLPTKRNFHPARKSSTVGELTAHGRRLTAEGEDSAPQIDLRLALM
jgi:hypothetical protein